MDRVLVQLKVFFFNLDDYSSLKSGMHYNASLEDLILSLSKLQFKRYKSIYLFA